MTTYGTIPSSSSSTTSPNVEYLSRAKQRIKSGLGHRRPWKQMLTSLNAPHGASSALARIKTNLTYFRMNYAIITLVILFLSLLWHPVSLIVFVLMMCAWLFLYFLRDEALVVFGRTVDDRTVLVVLSVVTVCLLLLTGATWNIVSSVLIGLCVVLVHAVLRDTDDLLDDVEDGGGGGYYVASSSAS